MFDKIIHELREHSPFTLFGAMAGVIFMMVFRKIPHEVSHNLFYVFHPLHICLSAFVTTAIYKKYMGEKKINFKTFMQILIIGYVGSVGIGSLSDSLIPFWGEAILDMPHRKMHVGFIEKWWLINPLAIASIFIAYYKPFTKLPHSGHVLLSTWASLFHMLMAVDSQHPIAYFGIFLFLFLAVWLPCCLSDIIFPLFFVKNTKRNK